MKEASASFFVGQIRFQIGVSEEPQEGCKKSTIVFIFENHFFDCRKFSILA